MNELALCALLPAFVAALGISLLRRTRLERRLADHPVARSLHTLPTPRLGGIGIVLAVAPFAAIHSVGPLTVAFACALGLAAISLADDLRSLPVAVRLGAHAIASTVTLHAFSWPFGWMGGIVLGAALVWSTNLYNFMDGSDGLAGGMGVIGFAALSAAAAAAGSIPLALVCASIASACCGFLLHNFPPARVFLGDAGAIPLGFLAGVLGLAGALEGAWPPWFPVLVFSPFVVDATLTLARRAARGERVWVAHRDHAYQQLVLAGWPRARLACFAYALMAAAAASALAGRTGTGVVQCAIIFAWAAIYGLLALAVVKRTTRAATARK